MQRHLLVSNGQGHTMEIASGNFTDATNHLCHKYFIRIPCIIIDDGKIFVWGSGSEGQLGLGISQAEATEPVALELNDKVKSLSCGYYHTAFVTGKYVLDLVACFILTIYILEFVIFILN